AGRANCDPAVCHARGVEPSDEVLGAAENPTRHTRAHGARVVVPTSSWHAAHGHHRFCRTRSRIGLPSGTGTLSANPNHCPPPVGAGRLIYVLLWASRVWKSLNNSETNRPDGAPPAASCPAAHQSQCLRAYVVVYGEVRRVVDAPRTEQSALPPWGGVCLNGVGIRPPGAVLRIWRNAP